MDENSKTEEQEQAADIDEIKSQHAVLVGKVDALVAKRDYFLYEDGKDVTNELKLICDRREADFADNLRHSCRPSETPALRAAADAFAEMGRIVMGLAWDDEIEAAQARLSNFEDENVLLLGDDDGEASVTNP